MHHPVHAGPACSILSGSSWAFSCPPLASTTPQSAIGPSSTATLLLLYTRPPSKSPVPSQTLPFHSPNFLYTAQTHNHVLFYSPSRSGQQRQLVRLPQGRYRCLTPCFCVLGAIRIWVMTVADLVFATCSNSPSLPSMAIYLLSPRLPSSCPLNLSPNSLRTGPRTLPS